MSLSIMSLTSHLLTRLLLLVFLLKLLITSWSVMLSLLSKSSVAASLFFSCFSSTLTFKSLSSEVDDRVLFCFLCCIQELIVLMSLSAFYKNNSRRPRTTFTHRLSSLNSIFWKRLGLMSFRRTPV